METGTLAERVVAALIRRGERVAVAESLTGGRVAALLTGVPGASAVVLGAVVSYATEVKTSVLGVPPDLVEQHGVVSGECAEAMATGVRRLLGSAWGLATTGVAGPARQDGQPVGTVFVGLAGPAAAGGTDGTGAGEPGDRVSSIRLALSGSRAEIQDAAAREALAHLLAAVQGGPPTAG